MPETLVRRPTVTAWTVMRPSTASRMSRAAHPVSPCAWARAQAFSYDTTAVSVATRSALAAATATGGTIARPVGGVGSFVRDKGFRG